MKDKGHQSVQLQTDDLIDSFLEQSKGRDAKARQMSLNNKNEVKIFSDCFTRVQKMADTIEMFENINIEEQTFGEIFDLLQTKRDFD